MPEKNVGGIIFPSEAAAMLMEALGRIGSAAEAANILRQRIDADDAWPPINHLRATEVDIQDARAAIAEGIEIIRQTIHALGPLAMLVLGARSAEPMSAEDIATAEQARGADGMIDIDAMEGLARERMQSLQDIDTRHPDMASGDDSEPEGWNLPDADEPDTLNL